MKNILYHIRSYPLSIPGILILLFWIFMAILGPVLVNFTYTEMDGDFQISAPGKGGHLLGTDALGRDIWARLVEGSRSILTVALLTSLCSSCAGTVIGFMAGYFGGILDEIFLRIMDLVMAIPPLVLAMVVLGILGGSSIPGLTLIMSIAHIPATARVARGTLLTIKNREFVDAARIMGEKHLVIMFVEILPNTVGPIIVEATARFAYSIMMLASLGFLGVGLQPPTPDWGMMVIENKSLITFAPWTVMYPSLAIASLVIGISLFSDLVSRVLLHEE